MPAAAVDLAHFGVPQADKSETLVGELWDLTRWHRDRCEPYQRILDALAPSTESTGLAALPWIPVRLFKEYDLRSVPAGDVFRVLTSSGTTGSAVSRIHLDADAAATHSLLLARTMAHVLGPHRLPMLIIDSKSVTRGSSFSARGAGVLGMMNFGRKHAFALDDDEQLDVDAVRRFLTQFGDQPFLVFGFTFMVWKYLAEVGLDTIDLRNGTLVHSGGWKRLQDQAVDSSRFRAHLTATTGLTRMFNFYGMVEQIGTVYIESPAGDGTLCCPGFADVIIRDPLTHLPVPHGDVGLIQTMSLSPRSYPGHSLLTEDIGRVVGVDDQPWMGHRFEVLGRLPRAEARGCSDTFKGAA